MLGQNARASAYAIGWQISKRADGPLMRPRKLLRFRPRKGRPRPQGADTNFSSPSPAKRVLRFPQVRAKLASLTYARIGIYAMALVEMLASLAYVVHVYALRLALAQAIFC
jgi:hypothetical protein